MFLLFLLGPRSFFTCFPSTASKNCCILKHLASPVSVTDHTHPLTTSLTLTLSLPPSHSPSHYLPNTHTHTQYLSHARPSQSCEAPLACEGCPADERQGHSHRPRESPPNTACTLGCHRCVVHRCVHTSTGIILYVCVWYLYCSTLYISVVPTYLYV